MAPTALLDLPDEILEIVIDKLIRSIGTRSDGTFNAADVQPVFPMRPSGATDLVALRQTCRRLQALVDGRSMQSVAIDLCPGKGTSTQKHATAPLAPAFHRWHILQPDSELKDKVKHLSTTICYPSDHSRISKCDSYIRRAEAELAAAMQAFGSTIENLRVRIYEGGWTNLFGGPPISHNGITKACSLPALRSLRLDDASLYFFLPVLALKAPLLERVTLDEQCMRLGADGLQNYIKATFAMESDLLRLPPSGSWKELVVTMPGSSGPSNSVLFSRISFAADMLVLGQNGWESGMSQAISIHGQGELAWEQNIVQFASDALVSGQFGNLTFRANHERPVRNMAGAQLIQRQAEMSEAIRAEVDRKGGDPNVPIIWNE